MNILVGRDCNGKKKHHVMQTSDLRVAEMTDLVDGTLWLSCPINALTQDPSSLISKDAVTVVSIVKQK